MDGPLPVQDLRQVFAMVIYVAFVLDEFGPELLFEIDPFGAALRQPIEGVHP